MAYCSLDLALHHQLGKCESSLCSVFCNQIAVWPRVHRKNRCDTCRDRALYGTCSAEIFDKCLTASLWRYSTNASQHLCGDIRQMPRSISGEALFPIFHHRRPVGGDFHVYMRKRCFCMLFNWGREVSVLCSVSLPVLLLPVLLLMAPETSTSRTGS